MSPHRFKRFIVVITLLVSILFILAISGPHHTKNRQASCRRSFGSIVHPILIANISDVADEPRSKFVPEVLAAPSGYCANLTIIVHSHADHVEERKRLRGVFSRRWLSRLGANLIFVTGQGQRGEEDEGNIPRDLLTTNVPEHYHSISLKAQAWIRYMNATCVGRKGWVLKIDDDVEVDLNGIERLLRRYRSYSRTIMGKLYINGVVSRNAESKWYLSPAEFAGNRLRTYLQGMAYFLSVDLLPVMAANIERVQILWMDDWYTTHALLNGTETTIVDVSEHIVSSNSEEDISRILSNPSKSPFIFGHFRPAATFLIRVNIRSRVYKAINSGDSYHFQYNNGYTLPNEAYLPYCIRCHSILANIAVEVKEEAPREDPFPDQFEKFAKSLPKSEERRVAIEWMNNNVNRMRNEHLEALKSCFDRIFTNPFSLDEVSVFSRYVFMMVKRIIGFPNAADFVRDMAEIAVSQIIPIAYRGMAEYTAIEDLVYTSFTIPRIFHDSELRAWEGLSTAFDVLHPQMTNKQVHAALFKMACVKQHRKNRGMVKLPVLTQSTCDAMVARLNDNQKQVLGNDWTQPVILPR